MPVLETNTGLKRVVIEVGLVLLLVDPGESRKDAVRVRFEGRQEDRVGWVMVSWVKQFTGNTLSIVKGIGGVRATGVGQWKSIDLPAIILIPTARTDILHYG